MRMHSLNWVVGLLVFPMALCAAFTPANRPIDVENYKISLELDPTKNPDRFDAMVEIRLRAKSDIKTIELDQQKLTLKSAQQLPATQLKTDTAPNKFVLHLPTPLKKGEVANFRLAYSGEIGSAHHGFFKVTDPDEPERGPLFFTHFEPLEARSFFPGNDEPYDKATTEMKVTVPERFEALSNGRIVSTQKKGKLKTVHWKMDKPHSTYLVSLAVGDFAKVASAYKGKEVSVWVGKTKTKKAEYALNRIKSSMAFFEDFLGVPYPWPQYATVTIPTFIWGGMENTSSTHQNQDRTLLNDPDSEMDKTAVVSLASHELAHQWFGDLATLKWWDDLWLNETFASYLDTQATQATFGKEGPEIDFVLNTWDYYFHQEDGPRSHPIVDKQLDTAEDAFDAISYTKGENVLRMLEHYVGRDALRAGMRGYLKTYAYGNATYKDFFDSVAKASKTNLDKFRDTWLLQRGYPILSFSSSWDSKTSTSQLVVNQKSNHAEDKSLFHFRLPVVFHRKQKPSYHQAAVLEMDRANAKLDQKLPAAPEWITVNPGSVILAKVTGSQPEAVLSMQALEDPDPITRIRATFDLLDPLITGNGTVSDNAMQTAVSVLETDPSAYVRLAVLSVFSRMRARYVPAPLGNAVFKLAKTTTPAKFDQRAGRLWRAQLLGALGKVEGADVGAHLQAVLADKNQPLDCLSAASQSMAALNTPQSLKTLKQAVATHRGRGYRYRYVVEFAFGALETPQAAKEIEEIFKTSSSDLVGRMGRLVGHNHTLKNSPEWAGFLKTFILKDTKHGDEVKARLLQTVEDVKNPSVQELMDTVARQSESDRLKGLAKKILSKNFAAGGAGT